VAATADAKPVLPVDPDHSHEAVMRQLRFKRRGDQRRPTNQGFVASYEEKGRGLTPPRFEGLLGPVVNWSIRHRPFKKRIKNRGELVMRCHAPSQVPVLSELALKFGVCSMWFSSVPGETWPNRNFMHAATSDGKTDNDFHFYNDCTIFELLERRGKHWHIYHDDTPQVWAFRWLLHQAHHWFTFSEFENHVKRGELPHYSFIEPGSTEAHLCDDAFTRVRCPLSP
jgi:phospholipase C